MTYYGGKDTMQQIQSDYITKTFAREPAGETDLWKGFVRDITEGDADFAHALQTWVGASVFRGNKLNKVHVLFGDGGSGKSVFLRALQSALGDYAGSVDPTLFTDRVGQHPANLLPLIENHFVVAPELAAGSLKSDLLKTASGDDLITVRSMRQNPRTESVRASIWFSCNELPNMRVVDKSIRRRLLIWPFNHVPKRENPSFQRYSKQTNTSRVSSDGSLTAWGTIKTLQRTAWICPYRNLCAQRRTSISTLPTR